MLAVLTCLVILAPDDVGRHAAYDGHSGKGAD